MQGNEAAGRYGAPQSFGGAGRLGGVALTKANVVKAYRVGPADVERMTRSFYRAKAAEYRTTLLELLHRHGETDRQRVLLSPEIRAALLQESREHAEKVAGTLNGFLEAEAGRRRRLAAPQLAQHLAGYMRQRYRNRAPMIALNEVSTARLDAVLAFYRENGYEVDFDFVGPAPKCGVCKRLYSTGPHALPIVLKIGRPHLNCRHRWRARTRAREGLRGGGLRPGQITAGRGLPGGIVGGDPLVNITGSQERALQVLDGLGLGD